MFTLYTTPLSANGRKVLAVSQHLALAPEIKLVNVYQGEGRVPSYLAQNPRWEATAFGPWRDEG
jgi:glutathione S-transferase